MDKISVIIPCYNEEESIPLFYNAITIVFRKMKINYELIFVDDGSNDKSFEKIEKLSKDSRVQYILFSRNFGKEAAIYAGLKKASGDYVCTMDVDLQDPPDLIPTMYETLKNENYDCVGTRRVTRAGEPKIRSFFARLFYKIINKMSKIEMVDGARDFRLMTRQMVDAVLEMTEVNRYSKGLFSFVGFNTKYLEYENIQRVAGETKWSFWKLFVYAIDGIVAFSTMPVVFAAFVGFLFYAVALALLIAVVVRGFCDVTLLSIFCLGFFLAGTILIFIGILGEYLAKTYIEVKHRPIYIIKKEK